jgi:thioredoxin 1
MADELITLTEATFDAEVARSSKPTLVDFWADGCGPCMALVPLLEDVAREHSGALRIAKINLADAPDIARRFEIMTLPTLIVFVAGEPRSGSSISTAVLSS